jgi:hypothetical protein
MSQDMGEDDKGGPTAGPSLHLSLSCLNDSPTVPTAGTSAVTPLPAPMAQQPLTPSAHHDKIPLTVDTERGGLRAEGYLDKLHAARAELIGVERLSCFKNDTVTVLEASLVPEFSISKSSFTANQPNRAEMSSDRNAG